MLTFLLRAGSAHTGLIARDLLRRQHGVSVDLLALLLPLVARFSASPYLLLMHHAEVHPLALCREGAQPLLILTPLGGGHEIAAIDAVPILLPAQVPLMQALRLPIHLAAHTPILILQTRPVADAVLTLHTRDSAILRKHS